VPKASGVKTIKDINPISIILLQNRMKVGSGIVERAEEESDLSLEWAALTYTSDKG